MIVAGAMGTSIASPWRRLAAACVDQILMAVGVGGFSQLVSRLGGGPAWSLPLFAAVSIAYFGLQHSRLTDGQTVGKRLFKIRVVGAHGEILSVERATGRALISHGASVVALVAVVALGAPIGTAVGLAIAAMVNLVSWYLIVADPSGRRGLPDRIAHTWVVDAEGFVVLPPAEPLRSEQVTVAAAIVGCVVASGLILGHARRPDPIEQPDVAGYRRVADSLGVPIVQGPIKRKMKGSHPEHFNMAIFVAVSADSTDAPFDSLAYRVARGVAGELPPKNDVFEVEIEVRESTGAGTTRPWHFKFPLWRLPPL